ncbi:MAG: hypothetical protein ACHP9Y_04270 [Gammaproteobacteria bacterium]
MSDENLDKKLKNRSLLKKILDFFRAETDEDEGGGSGTGAIKPISRDPIQLSAAELEQLTTKAANADIIKRDTEATFLPLHDLIMELIKQSLNKTSYPGNSLISGILPTAQQTQFAMKEAMRIKYGLEDKNKVSPDVNPDMEPQNDERPRNTIGNRGRPKPGR